MYFDSLLYILIVNLFYDYMFLSECAAYLDMKKTSHKFMSQMFTVFFVVIINYWMVAIKT